MNNTTNGAVGPIAPVATTHEDLLNVIIAKAAEFDMTLDAAQIAFARQKLAEVPQDKVAFVAHVLSGAPRDILMQHMQEMMQTYTPPAAPPGTVAAPGTTAPGTTAPAATAPAATAPAGTDATIPTAPTAPAPAFAAQFGTPAPATPRPPAAAPASGDQDPDEDIPGMVPMISGLYQLTDAAVMASAYTAVKNGQKVQRYRQVVGVVAKKRTREGKEPLFELRLSRPALLADHEGKIVEVAGGTALVPGIFAFHPLGSLLSFPDGFATVSIRPTHFDHDLAGNRVWHGVIRLLVEDQRDAQNRYIPKLVSPESVFGPGMAPNPTPTNGAAGAGTGAGAGGHPAGAGAQG